jgi:2-methylcitrate dehydratase PrpD
MNGIEELASFIAQLRDEQFQDGLSKLRLHVADTLGAWVAATATAEGKKLLAFRGGLRSERRAGPDWLDDVAINCALARLSEVDDIHLASMTTPGSVVIPAAMALAAQAPRPDTGDVAAAVLAGYEAMIRLGRAIKGPDVLYRGIWPTYFAAGFATAAVGACLLRLDERQTGHALAVALTWGEPSVGQHHAVTTARWLSVGHAARGGVMAALAARAGFTADLDVLKSRLLPDVYGIEPDLAAMTDGLGSVLAFSEVSMKPWCAARQTMAATQALVEIVGEGVSTDECSEITAAVLPPHLRMINHGVRAGDRASYVTSLPYQMAVAVLQPERTLDIGAPPTPDDRLQAFMGRINVVADESLLAGYPAAWPARVTVGTAQGRREKLVRHVPGDPDRALGEAAVARKFHRLVAPVLGEGEAGAAWEAVRSALQSPDALLSVTRALRAVGEAVRD